MNALYRSERTAGYGGRRTTYWGVRGTIGGMDVLIAGAGVGGLALARGLLAEGHEVRVLERADGPRDGGAAVTIFSNGAAAASRLGAPLDGLGGAIEELRFCSAGGELTSAADLRVMRRRTGFGAATVSRRQLTDRLSDSLPAGVVRYGRAVEKVSPVPDGVEVIDSTGEHHSADVLVGADGYNSAVRRAIDPEPAADTGWATWQGLDPLPIELAQGNYGLCQVGAAGLCGLMPAGDGLVQWWFDTPWSRTDEPPASVADWLRERFAGYADPVPAVLTAITDAGLYPHVLHRVPKVWGAGRTTLVGDAAHAFPPTMAQGANQTLEDAWLLTRALSLPGDPAELLRRYEHRRTRRVRPIARLAGTERTNQVQHPVVQAVAKRVPAAWAGWAYLRLIQRCSSVLNDETP